MYLKEYFIIMNYLAFKTIYIKIIIVIDSFLVLQFQLLCLTSILFSAQRLICFCHKHCLFRYLMNSI